MKFERRFGKRKRGNSQRGLLLVVVLGVVLYMFMNAEKILGNLL